jgi:ATP-dependent helicase Lhr and Lhr-like helicase
MKTLLGREFLPEKALLVERINGKPSARSDYAGALREFGFQGYYKGLELARKY